MVNYSLCLEKNGEVKKIDLSFLMNSKKLIDLDLFTSEFENQEQLLKEISNNGLVLTDIKNQKLKITYTHNSKIRIIPVLYRSARKYVFNENEEKISVDVECIRHKLHSLCKDYDFLNKLAEYYGNYTALVNCIDNITSSGDYELYSNELRILINELYSDKVFPNGNFYYGGLRNIALFIDRYETTKKYNEAKKAIEDDLPIYDRNMPLTNDGSPLYPPNSEEEARFLAESENDVIPPIESHPHYRR